MSGDDRCGNGRFEGRAILVTGAGQGIGATTARRFAEAGARVAVNDLHPDTDLRTMNALPPVAGGPHLAFPGNVADERNVSATMRDMIAAMGTIDVLVCNAGFQIPSPSHALRLQDFNDVMAVNVGGVVLYAREALAHWTRTGTAGTIVVVGSVHQTIPKPGYLGYSASKGAVTNIVRTLALEYAARGIRINAVAPGAIVTPMNAAWTDDPAQRAAVSRHIPMHRPGEPDEIADAILFLASAQAAYITGQTLFVDGGLTLYGDFQENWSS